MQLIRCKSEEDLTKIKEEAKMLFALSHANIVRYYSSFLHETFGGERDFCMVMELCEGGTLKDKIMAARTSGVPLLHSQVGIWMHEMASALAFLHANVSVGCCW